MPLPSPTTPAPSPQAEREAAELDLAQKALARFRDDPVQFAWVVLGVRLWSKQVEIMRAVARHRRVAVRSGHKIGKSSSAAILALWWVLTRKNARVIMTSASSRQVRSILWREIKKLYREARVRVGPRPAELPDIGIQFEDGREVVGFSTNEPERMAGTSGENLLYIIDEASGVDAAIFEAIEGNRAAGATIVLFSNPTKTSGEFYEAFTTKANLYHCIQVSSEDTPNVRCGRNVIPGLASRDWIIEKRREWGGVIPGAPQSEQPYRKDPRYQVRVRGEFPLLAAYAVVPLELIEAAMTPERLAAARKAIDGRLSIGVDVARFGDDESVIQPRRGALALPAIAVHGFDTVEVSGLVLHTARKLRHEIGEEKVFVNIDDPGVGGGVTDTIQHAIDDDSLDWLVLTPVNTSVPADDEFAEDYGNLRAQLAFGVRTWLEKGGALEPDQELKRELVAAEYSFDGKGRIVVEPKKAIKKKLGRSPDRADALALAVYEPAGMGVVWRPSTSRSHARMRGRGYG